MDYNHNQSISQQFTFSSQSQHFLGILLSLLPFTKNLPFTRRPNSCIVVWQQLTCLLVFLASLSWLLIGCSWFKKTGVFVSTQRRRLHTRLYIMWSVFVNDDGHKRGQASRPVVGAEIQTNCNFETHVSHCSYLLGYLKFFWAVVYFKLPYNLMAWPCKHIKHITSSANLNHLVHKDFSYSQSSSG